MIEVILQSVVIGLAIAAAFLYGKFQGYEAYKKLLGRYLGHTKFCLKDVGVGPAYQECDCGWENTRKILEKFKNGPG